MFGTQSKMEIIIKFVFGWNVFIILNINMVVVGNVVATMVVVVMTMVVGAVGGSENVNIINGRGLWVVATIKG